MFERFTKRARAVVGDAVGLAQAAGDEDVRPEHLLAALVSDPDCLAARVLVGCGVVLADVEAGLTSRRDRFPAGLGEEDAQALATIGIDLEEVLRRVADEAERPGRRRPRFSRPAKKVLELSLREAVALRHNYIGTEHLLLGLARQGDVAVREALAAYDVAPDLLRKNVTEALRRAG